MENNSIEVTLTVKMLKRENETEEQAQDRLYNVLYDGLCNNAEHQIEFTYE